MSKRLLAMVLAVCALGQASCKPGGVADQSTIDRVRSDGHDTAIVFVHGIFGNESTFGAGDQFWPKMVASDPLFKDADIYVYTYGSSLIRGGLDISQLAGDMHQALDRVGLPGKVKRLIVVCHSMGGLVTRSYLTDYREEVRGKMALLYFFATPSAGSELAALGRYFLPNTQLANMSPTEGDKFLRDLQVRWLAAGYGRSVPSYCAYETKPTAAGIVVPWASAFGLCNEGIVAIAADHVNIVKPKDLDAAPHVALSSAYRQIIVEGRASSITLVPASSIRLTYDRESSEFGVIFNGVVKSTVGAADAVTDIYAQITTDADEAVPFGNNDVACTRSGQAVSVPFLLASSEIACTFRQAIREDSRRILTTPGKFRIAITFETDDKRGYSARYCATLDAEDLAGLFGGIGQFRPLYSLCQQ